MNECDLCRLRDAMNTDNLEEAIKATEIIVREIYEKSSHHNESPTVRETPFKGIIDDGWDTPD